MALVSDNTSNPLYLVVTKLRERLKPLSDLLLLLLLRHTHSAPEAIHTIAGLVDRLNVDADLDFLSTFVVTHVFQTAQQGCREEDSATARQLQMGSHWRRRCQILMNQKPREMLERRWMVVETQQLQQWQQQLQQPLQRTPTLQ